VIITEKWKGLSRVEGLIPEEHRSLIEILYEDPSKNASDRIVIICHPNPLAQGSLNHKIPTLVARTAHSLGLPSLRFQFSGIGLTTSVYKSFEQQVRLLDQVIHRAQEEGFRQIVLAGFSFGGACILQNPLSCPKLSLAPAWKFLSTEIPPTTHITICHALDDTIALAQDSIQRFPSLPSKTKTLIVFDKGEHFFQDQQRALSEQCAAFFREHLLGDR